MILKQSSTVVIPFLMTLASDHISAATGLSPTVTLSKAGAAFGAAAGTVVEVGSGWYKLTPTSADTGTLGFLAMHASAATADPVDDRFRVVAYDPDDAVALGLSRVDATVSSRATPAQILTTPANLLATDGTGRVTVGTNADKTGYTASTVSDKTGYALTVGEHTSIGTDTQTGLTAQGYTTTRAGYLDTLNGLVAAVWANATRTLSAFGFSVTASTVSDKTGYALTAGEHTTIQSDVTSGLTTQGYTGARATKLDDLDATVSSRLASASYTAPDNADVIAIKAKTDNLPASPAATADVPTANANADALLDRANAVETGWTLRMAIRIMLAVLNGKIGNAGTTTNTYRNIIDTKDRVTATVDSAGNRTAIILDGS